MFRNAIARVLDALANAIQLAPYLARKVRLEAIYWTSPGTWRSSRSGRQD